MYNNIDKRRLNDYWDAIKKTYKEFCEGTTIHGLKYTVQKENNIIDKIIWILIVLFGLVGSVLIVNLFWNRYNSTPTRTSVETNFASSSEIRFPAISFCNLNRISNKKLDRFMRSLEYRSDESDIVKRALSQLWAFTHPTRINYNMTELMILQKVLAYNDYVTPIAYMRRITINCNELLIKCKWDNKETDCMDLFSTSYSTDGICCIFNANLGKPEKALRSGYYGPDSGLTAVINPHYEEERYSVYHSNGIKIIVHKYEDYPGIGSTHKFIAIGRSLYLQIAATSIVCTSAVKLLSMFQRNCAFLGEISLDYFEDYTDSNCYTECTIKRILKLCKCVPYYYSSVVSIFNKGVGVCNISDIPCLNKASQNMSEYHNKICNCLPECDDTVYDMLSTSSSIIENNMTTSSFLTDANITNDHILLHVFFSSYSQTILRRDVITSIIYLISSLGGIFSLFLGCSFISVAEIFYYVFIRFYLNLKNANKISNKEDVDESESANKIFTVYDNKMRQNVFIH